MLAATRAVALARRAASPAPWQSLWPLSSQSGAQEDVFATEIKYSKASKSLEVAFSSGERYSYPAELLRVESPAAEAPKDALGRPKIVHGRRHVGITGIEPVGTYAVRLQFDDMHGTGIYTWPFLQALGRHKLSRCRQYIRLLQRHGLSRDPAPPRGGRRAGAGAQRCSTGAGGDTG